IIKRPLDTEKLDRMRDRENKFAFEIDMKANKTEIKQAIEALFKVKVVAIKTAIVRGKFRRIGRNEGKRPNWKKAIVTLKEGDAISLFEGKQAMALKFYKPTSPGRRLTTSPDFAEITKTTPERMLTKPLKATGSRNVD